MSYSSTVQPISSKASAARDATALTSESTGKPPKSGLHPKPETFYGPVGGCQVVVRAYS